MALPISATTVVILASSADGYDVSMKRPSPLGGLRRTNLMLAQLLLLLLSGRAWAQPQPDHWAQFVGNPTDENQRRVTEAVSRCEIATCLHDVAPDSAAVVTLVQLIRKGSRPALDLGFLGYRLLDGGDLEDMARSLGEVADTSPSLFLEEAKKHHLLPKQVDEIVAMLPANVIDDDAQRRRAVAHRIRALLTVTDSRLLDMRNAAVARLRRLEEHLK